MALPRHTCYVTAWTRCDLGPSPGVPPFGADSPSFWYCGTGHGMEARMADRAVLVELRRFLTGIHTLRKVGRAA